MRLAFELTVVLLKVKNKLQKKTGETIKFAELEDKQEESLKRKLN